MTGTVRIALTGDVMLGRLVNRYAVRPAHVALEHVWGDVLPLLASCDLRLINLECVISARGEPWRPQHKPFHFRADPRAIDVLRAAGIDGVTLANNHVLDYGVDALHDCLDLLDQAGIGRAGAGRDLDEAMCPAYFDTPLGKLAVIALTDNMPEWAAAPDRSGVTYVAYDGGGLIEPYRSRVQAALDVARQQAVLVIVSAHVGPNWGPPSPAMRALAYDLVERGADLYWGHSGHTPLGIEAHRGAPVLYAAGDFIDDYAIDPEERNDLSFLFVVELGPQRIERIVLHPVKIERLQVFRAAGWEAQWLLQRMELHSSQLGGRIVSHDTWAEVRL